MGISPQGGRKGNGVIMTIPKRVLVAMSGGVDSSIAAFLLKDQGYDVGGVTMCLGMREREEGRVRCCGPNAVEDARRVCKQLDIPHYVLDYAAEFERKIIQQFVEEYKRGRTPNPCVECNRRLKFGRLLDEARLWGYDYLATGHYAGVEKRDGDYVLVRPRDRRKDQTYFLYAIRPAVLEAVLFPLASFTKDEVRRLAEKKGLSVSGKGESQDICFVNRKHYGHFLARRLGEIKPGPITDTAGNMLGEHKGIVYYTIGQRSGLGVSVGTPLYVLAIDVAENRIVVGNKEQVRAQGLKAGNLNILRGSWPPLVSGKVRYGMREARCRAILEGNRLAVVFEEPQEAITPGQSVVLYDGDVVLGGGVIEELIREAP